MATVSSLHPILKLRCSIAFYKFSEVHYEKSSHSDFDVYCATYSERMAVSSAGESSGLHGEM